MIRKQIGGKGEENIGGGKEENKRGGKGRKQIGGERGRKQKLTKHLHDVYHTSVIQNRFKPIYPTRENVLGGLL